MKIAAAVCANRHRLQMFAELGLGSSQGKRHRHLRGCTFESDAPRAPEEVCEVWHSCHLIALY